MACATSPGRIWVPAKIRTEMANKRRMPSAMRWAISFRMGEDISAKPDSGLQPALRQGVAVHQFLMRIVDPAIDLGTGSVDELVEHRQDQAAFVAHQDSHVVVHLLALGLVELGARRQ